MTDRGFSWVVRIATLLLPQIKAGQENRGLKPMRVRATGAKAIFIGSLLALCSPSLASPANASEPVQPRPVYQHSAHHHVVYRHLAVHHALVPEGHVQHAVWHGRRTPTWHHVAYGGGISCVPFARRDSGIELTGNAWQWWGHATGVYARGQVPESGAVLAFRSNPRMRLGHVAVVSRIVNAREVEIDHANWWGPGMRGGVAHNVPVVDVSEANDWSAVRVGLGQTGSFGAVYPTYGFIYDRADTGVRVAAGVAPAPQPALNPAPRDLRPVAERPWHTYEEVAQAPATATAPGVTQVRYSSSVGTIDPK
jgi:hypothetical protein